MAPEGIIKPKDFQPEPYDVWSTERTLDVVRDFVRLCPDEKARKGIFERLQAKGIVAIPDNKHPAGEYPAKFTRHARKVAGAIEGYMDANKGAVPILAELDSFQAKLASAKRRMLMQNIAKAIKHPIRAVRKLSVNIRKV